MGSILILCVVWVVGWLVYSYFCPWTTCRLCKGNPRHGTKKAFNRWCKLCGTTGRRRRWGARLLRRGFGQ